MKSSNIGGQAVMEGIMMRHKDVYSIAVRKPDKEIEVKVEDYKSVMKNKKILSLPIIRGVFSFIDSLVIGTKCLMYSASFFEEEEEEKAKKEALSGDELTKYEAKQKKQENVLMTITMIFSVVISVGLFMVLPYLIASLLRKVGAGESAVTVAEAFIRIALFLAYLVLISKMQDIQRVFMYHGAEHKCINCVESGKALTVENVMKSSRFHKRCGTSFLFFVIIISIIFFIGFFAIVPVKTMWMRVVIRVLLVPVVAGVSYEFIRLAGNSENKVVALLSKPGLCMQKLTTKEPTPDMAEVAIMAVEAVFDWKAYLRENFENAEGEIKKAEEANIQQEKQMITYRTLLSEGKEVLQKAKIMDFEIDAWLLMEFVFQIDRARFFLEQNETVEEEKAETYRRLLAERAKHIPVQQITHEAWFFGLPFYVNENVLIPRQDTEVLIEEVLSAVKKYSIQTPKILDMCTGSGCILLSLLANIEGAEGLGADLSEKALEVAQKNGSLLNLKAEWCLSNLFSHINGKYDIIVSNPPYIESAVIETLMEEVREHEPRMALDGKEDGLYFYREITKQAGVYLNAGGILAFEIGYNQGEAVSQMLKEEQYEEIKVVKDLAGLDRVVIGRKKQEDSHV